ncbi:MAG: phosphate/phosphite/phosphonate ABC transporter substrate-binding protein [candidate division NC10 bacterium]|nr:phosphate/phosphite/phosphonate ABC transporter substrate-binding protein [candidate division NC10 bacterium]
MGEWKTRGIARDGGRRGRRYRNRRWVAACLVTCFAAAVWVGFSRESAQAATGITLALTPSKDPTLLQEAGTALAQELGKRLDLPIKLYVASDYAGVIEALRNQTVDLAFVHPVAYVLASREAKARILVKSLRGGSASYTARFFVLKDGGPKTLEELRGKTIAFVDPASTSGYIYPMVFLMKRGLVKGKDPRTFFREAVFSGAHDAVLHALVRRQVDVAVSYPHAPDTLLKEPGQRARLTYIAETPPIPNDGACVRDGLAPDLVQRLKAALLSLNDPVGRPLLKHLYAVDGLAEATDADFDPVREAVDLLSLTPPKR